MTNYSKALNLFTCRYNIDWKSKPFIVGDKVFATNGWGMITFDLDKLGDDELDEFDVYGEDKVPKALTHASNMSNAYTVKHLKECFQGIPLIEVEDEERSRKTCPECDGGGSVTFTYDDSDMETHYLDGACPRCHGAGIIGEKVMKLIADPETRCVINDCMFYANKVKLLIKVADLLNVSEVVHVLQTTIKDANRFKVGDVNVLIMPCPYDNDQVIVWI